MVSPQPLSGIGLGLSVGWPSLEIVLRVSLLYH